MADAPSLGGGANNLEPPKAVSVPPSLSCHFDEIETANKELKEARGALTSAHKKKPRNQDDIKRFSELVAQKQQQHKELIQKKIEVIKGMIENMTGEIADADAEKKKELRKQCEAFQATIKLLEDSGAGPDRSVRGIKIGITLGKGAYGRVKLGIVESTGQRFAMKFVKKKNPNFRLASLRREVECMKKINHPNVLQLRSVNENCQYPCRDGTMEDCFLMIIDHMPGGDLYDLIMYTGPMPEKLGRTLFKQLLDGLKAIHDYGITHRDIKPSNILIDAHFNLKHTDFGLSHIAPDDTEDYYKYRMMRPRVGTRGYRAPEMHFERSYNNKIDLFSLGVCLYIMLTKRQPFKTAQLDDPWYSEIVKHNYLGYWKKVKKPGFPLLSAECKDFFNKILCYQPSKRITLAECFEHPWMQGDMFEPKELYKIMHKLHRHGRQAKMADPKRDQRLASSVGGEGANRALGDDDEEVKDFESRWHTVPTIVQVEPKWFSWEMRETGNEAKILSLIKTYLKQKLLCEFEIAGDYQLSSKYAAETRNYGKGKIAFDLRVVKRGNKSVFVCAPEKTTWFSLLETLERTVLDGLSRGNSVKGYFLERWDEGYVAPKAEFDFTVFEGEDPKIEEYSHEDLEDEEQKAIREAEEQKAAKADTAIEEEVIAKDD